MYTNEQYPDIVKKKLTDKQRKVLRYIKDHIVTRGSAPTIREIGKYMGITSTNGVRLHLTALIKKGYLKKQEYIARGLELATAPAMDIRQIPLVGSVPAGLPIDAIENVEGEIALDASFAPRGDSFTLRVVGDSMRDAGIFDGDIVLVQKQDIARKGDIVVAIIGDEATVKRYYPEGRQVKLEPANDDFEPIIINKRSREFRIAGKVVGLMRKLS
ncbi:MAG: transcriptional repressor LexA [Candidatus Zixiibacteriota bacterium]|nr:MAG: transcriptional repressor LexA [candidate division Zixibacteria bacterium]